MNKSLKKILNHVLSKKNKTSRYLLKLKREYRIREFERSSMRIVEICGGKYPLDEGNLNMDVLDHPNVDILADISEPLLFKDGELNKVISIATLEHFNIVNLRKILKEFFRVLSIDGVLEIGVPSLSKIFSYYQSHGCDDLVIKYLHGAQKDDFDLHLSIMDFDRFRKELLEIGFKKVEEKTYDYPFHDKDMMMKIIAYK